MRRLICMDVLITGSEVWSARTTSRRRMTLAGEKKCRPMTASGRLVTEAISSMFKPLVLVARTAPGLAMASSRVNTSFLMSIRSNTASITRSAEARSSSDSDPVIICIRRSTSAIGNRPLRALRS